MSILRTVLLGVVIAGILWLCSVAARNYALALHVPVSATAATIDSVNNRAHSNR